MAREKRKASILANGRSRPRRMHLRLDHGVYESSQFQGLKAPARAVLFELIYRYRGHNNGRIAFPVRAGLRLHLSQATTSRALGELIEAGLISVSKASGFNQKTRTAAEFTLTFRPDQNGWVTFRPSAVANPEVDDGFTRDADSFTSEARRV